MKFESVMILWVVVTSILVYFEVERFNVQKPVPISSCCVAEIRYHHNPHLNNFYSNCNRVVKGIIS